jgi:hypothetical protein
VATPSGDGTKRTHNDGLTHAVQQGCFLLVGEHGDDDAAYTQWSRLLHPVHTPCRASGVLVAGGLASR